MRTTRLASILLALAAPLALPTPASANCYSVYDGQNRLAYQSRVSPIDLSGRISDAMRARFPGGYFIMLPNDADCVEFRAGPTTPRFDSGTGSGVTTGTERDRTFEAPLLRGAPAPVDSITSGNAPREAMRSGNNLNIRRTTP